MGRNKNKSKRDRRVRGKKNGKSVCLDPGASSAPNELENIASVLTGGEKYGIRQLLEETMESRNNSVSSTHPKCIDLSKDDVLCENEVIDLTETNTKSVEREVNEPTVIDITEEEINANSEGEDVYVIGTYSKPVHPIPPSTKPLLNPGLGELISYRKKVVVKNWLMFKYKNSSSKLKKKYKKRLLKLEGKEKLELDLSLPSRTEENFGIIGSNMYVNSQSPLPSTGLRPIIIDGNNVAFIHSNYHFCCKRLEICINYFKERGHKVMAFVPQFRMSSRKNDDPKLLRRLEKEGYVVLTPSKEIDGRSIVPYDDRFIVQTAVLKGGIIVSRDNYKDLLHENPAWADTIKYRTLAFTWVDDVLIFPEDPLGEFGPKLEEFLRFH